MKLACALRCTPSAFGPLRTYASDRHRGQRRRGKGASGQAGALHWSGLRFAPASLRCSVSRPRRRTRCVRFAHYAQTTATSQSTIRAARGATSPALLGAPQARSGLPGRAFAAASWVCATRNASATARQAVPGRGDLWGGEERRPSVGACSALRDQTRRNCLSVVSAANAASFATRLKAEHRSAVGAQRRPPQREPRPGTAWRAEVMHRRGIGARRSASGRVQTCEAHPRFMRRGSRQARWNH